MKIENISDLQVLVQTARGGTLTAAAHALGMTPAAASATLKRLETQLGARLFERSTRAMRLTSQGQTLLDYAVRAFELLDEGESLVTAERGELVGTLRVAAPSDLTRSTLLPWFDEFLALHPGVQLSLSVGDRLLDVTRDEVDVALRYGALADSRLVARPFALTHPLLTASPDYLRRHPAPKTPQDLVHHNCLTFDRGGRRHRTWRFAQNGQWTEVRVKGDRSVDDASLAREWAVAGRGITLKSALDVRNDISTGRLVHLLPEWDTEPYPLHALLPSGRFVPARVRALVDFLALKFEALTAVRSSA
ncbi:LysR family transcriptional regulator [Variovorax sp. V59]|uniref:LysR family transcriptional regulator n=1 Tax=unclassified Variovorax TaxID=663243 RepID=UPI0034E85D3C